MVLKPIDILRKGLKVLTNYIKSRKDVLQARLAEKSQFHLKTNNSLTMMQIWWMSSKSWRLWKTPQTMGKVLQDWVMNKGTL